MIKDYKITAKLIPGAVYLRYENQMLAGVLFELTQPLNPQVYDVLMHTIQQTENVQRLSQTYQVQELNNGRSVQDKIVMFCSSYKHYRGVPYKPKELEKANLKNTPITRELLDTFFNSPLANYTLDNYIKRINITRDWARNGMNNHLADAFPDEWNEEYSRKLDGDRLSKYYLHLKQLGWAKDDRGNWKQAVVTAIITMLLLTGCAYKPKPTRPDKLRARYESESNQKLNQWLDAEHPRKVVPTGTRRKRIKKNR